MTRDWVDVAADILGVTFGVLWRAALLVALWHLIQ